MSLQREVKELIRGEVRFNEALSRHTSLRIGGPAEVWAEPQDLDDLVKLVRYSTEKNIPFFVIGGGNNLLVRDEVIRGIVISLKSECFRRIELEGDCGLRASGGASLLGLVETAKENGLGGLEFMVGIPGTVGGAVAMNAGTRERTFGEVSGEIKVMDKEGKVFRLFKNEINFGYRTSGLDGYIIVESSLKLEKKPRSEIEKEMDKFLKLRSHIRRLNLPNAGSIFKNPKDSELPSGRLIELSGLGGSSVGSAQVWPEHCSFIVNLGDATSKDVSGLIEMIRTKVKADHSIDLELEVKVI